MIASLGDGAPIDVTRLIETRLLIQANSGGGKSYAIRRLLEQTHAHVPQIVLDVEGEFHTLRDRFDYVLAGKGGDCPAEVKSAALLARRLLELGVSAIVDLYELGASRALFVQRFLDALISAPRELWAPRLVVVDEAHLFAPEGGKSESAAAVIDLMTRGRKRGLCGVLATQRISKLRKDAAAECNNKMIGRTALDVDQRRAADELGMSSAEERRALRLLEPGTFRVFGPALSDDVRLVRVGPVQTAHPKAGARGLPPTPPGAKVRAVLAQLADLPAEAAEEERTVAELRARVRELERRPAAVPAPPAPPAKVIEKRMLDLKQVDRLERLAAALLAAQDKLAQAQQAMASELGSLRSAMWTAAGQAPAPPELPAELVSDARALAARAPRIGASPLPPRRGSNPASAALLPAGEAAVLRALIQYPAGLRREQLTVLTGYKRSTRDTYIARLRERGFVEPLPDAVRATAAGVAAMPDAEPLPVGAALREWWATRLPAGERAVLELLVSSYPSAMSRADIDPPTGFRRSTRDTYLSRLAAKELVVDAGRGAVQASATLFDGGRR